VTDERLSDSRQAAWPKVTVIIVNWNGERFIEQCLDRLMAQTVVPHEVILLDNASSDGSVEIARRFPSVRLMLSEENTGFARGNNLAIQAASEESEWIALLNPDAFAEPRWLEMLLVAARDYPSYDFFGSKLLNALDTARLDGAGDTYHISGLVWRMGHGQLARATQDESQEAFSPCAAAALYRRSALRQIGGFDEDFFCYVEDVDLGFRLRLAGHRCLYVPQSVAHHLGSGTTGGQHSEFALYHGHRNLVWTFVKDMPGILFYLLLPLHIFFNIVTIVWFALRGHGGVILRAKRDALSGLPAAWKKRRQIQEKRVVSAGEIWSQLDKRLFLARK
jgi:GT2 family glycosyltransferase